MKYRLTTIYSEADQTDGAGTKNIEINIADVVSRIEVKFRAKNGADGNSAHPAANVTKIELVDGSDVLFSLNGYETQAVNFYDRGEMIPAYIDTINTHWNTAWFGLDFGRFLMDNEWALDPKRFKNLQLKITFDEDVAQTSAAENRLSVYAWVFDGVQPSPRGYMMSKEIREYTGATDAYESTDLPTDFMIKQVYVVARYATNTFTTQVAEIRIAEDNLKRIITDLSSTQYFYITKSRYGWVEEQAYLKGVSSDTSFYSAATDWGHPLMAGYGADITTQIFTHDGGRYRYNTGSTGINAKAVIRGIFPHGVCPVLFSDKLDVSSWFDPKGKEAIELRVKAGSSYSTSGPIQIVTTQARTY